MTAYTMYRKALKFTVTAAFWAAVWYLLAFIVDKELFLPYPHRVAVRLYELILTADFHKTVRTSLFRILLGFAVGVFIGFVLALITHYIKSAKALLSPALRAVRATPVVSFILLAYLWLDNDTIPVFIALLMVVPIMWENVSAGLSSLDPKLTEMAQVFGFSRKATLTRVILPQLSPHFFSGALISLGLSWKSGIAAEVISYPTVAIGACMNDAKTVLETADVFAWTVVVVALSLCFEALFKLAFKGGRRV